MPLQIEFKTAGADRGTLRVRGLPEVGSEVLVAVQRLADARYLTMHGLWDEAASWFPCPRVDGDDPAVVRFETGTALSAGILGAAGEPLRLHLRRRDFTDFGPLEVRHPAPIHATAPIQAAPPVAPESALASPDTATDPLPDAKPRTPALQPARRHSGWRWVVLALCVIGLATLTWRYTTQKTAEPIPPGPPPPAPAPATGKALADELKRQNLPPAALFQRATLADQSGDCAAAIRLFVEAANRDATLADGLARRYDGAAFQPSPCFAEPKADSAMVWYERAARAGIPHAQRRYGELLLDETSAGPVYRDAIEWLRKAAAAGDAAAASRLAALGER
ncbi:hypothetical protein [uncultured Thiodictyon sp.]|uniref:hypothetical protein n=1 Tax=uncultured Thiodictyon sp. TaxID=1846217 RepID=UPI0025D0BA95|nr:hypothetical protein [uncultured Thiodictyon sp.]